MDEGVGTSLVPVEQLRESGQTSASQHQQQQSSQRDCAGGTNFPTKDDVNNKFHVLVVRMALRSETKTEVRHSSLVRLWSFLLRILRLLASGPNLLNCPQPWPPTRHQLACSSFQVSQPARVKNVADKNTHKNVAKSQGLKHQMNMKGNALGMTGVDHFVSCHIAARNMSATSFAFEGMGHQNHAPLCGGCSYVFTGVRVRVLVHINIMHAMHGFMTNLSNINAILELGTVKPACLVEICSISPSNVTAGGSPISWQDTHVHLMPK